MSPNFQNVGTLKQRDEEKVALRNPAPLKKDDLGVRGWELYRAAVGQTDDNIRPLEYTNI